MPDEKKFSAKCGQCHKYEEMPILASYKEHQMEFSGYDEHGEEVPGPGPLARISALAHCPHCKYINFLLIDVDHSSEEFLVGRPATLYPATSRLAVDDTYLLPVKLRRLVNEFFQAEGHKLYASAVLMLRTISETLLEHLNGCHSQSFKLGLKRANEAGHLTSQETVNLGRAYEMGSAVFHRGHKAEAVDAAQIWAVVSSVLESKIWDPERQKQKLSRQSLEAELAAESIASRTPLPPGRRGKRAAKQAN